MDVSPQALGVGVGFATSALLWWLLRGKLKQAKTKPSASPFAYVIPVAKVTKLYIYPVKSCHRIEVDSTDCFKRGLKYDRCWVIVDKNGSFCSQRGIPRMAKIKQELTLSDDGEVTLTLNAPGMTTLVLKEPKKDTETSMIKIWNLRGEGMDVGDEAARWLSQFLERDGCRLYYMAPHNKPRVLRTDPRWHEFTEPEDETSFADFSPVLLASEASLELLNSKMDSALEIERFRPNIVVSGCLPHAEDKWGAIRIGEQLILRGLKASGRCKMTTVDPEQGHFTGKEPIETLKKYRRYETVYNCEADSRFGSNPLFGFLYTIIHTGRVSVGDTIFTS